MKNLYLSLFFALATAFGAVSQTLVVDDHWDGATGTNIDDPVGGGKIGGPGNTSDKGKFQKFDPAIGANEWGTISTVRVSFGTNISSSPSTMELVITADDNGVPGADIHTQTLTFSDLAILNAATNPNGSPYNQEITLSSPVFVPGNLTFWVGFRFNNDPNGVFSIRTTEASDAYNLATTHTFSEVNASVPGNRMYANFVDQFSQNVALGIFPVIDVNTSVGSYQATQLEVAQNQPNPFIGVTTIPYTLDQSTAVTLEVMDVTGKIIRVQNLGKQSAGAYLLEFDANDLNSGIYFYTMTTAEGVRVTRKLTVSE
ncbi:MAG: T9SS type A sorting domain-containing protein [Salibacteraceae bacterium]